MDYEQVIYVLAMEKLMCEEELRATKSKMKLYDMLFFIMLGSFSVVCVGFGMLIGKQPTNACLQMQDANASCKCKMQLQAKMQAANASKFASCKCLLQIVTVVLRDFYKKFYNSINSVPNRCSVV
ncbi:hypothetical protein Tco_1408282 [Tanacetum coccineum]